MKYFFLSFFALLAALLCLQTTIPPALMFTPSGALAAENAGAAASSVPSPESSEALFWSYTPTYAANATQPGAPTLKAPALNVHGRNATQPGVPAANATNPSTGPAPQGVVNPQNPSAVPAPQGVVNATQSAQAERVLGFPEKTIEIPGRYVLGSVKNVPADVTDAEITPIVLAARARWKAAIAQVAWYAPGKRQGQGVLAVAESKDGTVVTITRAKDEADSRWLERTLCFPTTPGELSGAYLQNEVTADDDFNGKPVIFKAPIGDIARGAFNRPYVFFPSSEGAVTGLTCYFPNKDPNLRKIRKGDVVTVRGAVKGFLMQDVLLEDCDVLIVHE